MRSGIARTALIVLSFIEKADAKEPPTRHTAVFLHPALRSHLTNAINVTWTKVEMHNAHASPVGRIPAASASFSDGFFIFGGETDVNASSVPNRYLNDLWRFSPASGNGGVWMQLSPDGLPAGPPARVSSSMVYMQNRLVIYGGIIRTASGDNVHVGDVWSYDLQRSRWQQVMPNSSLVGGPDGLAAHTASIVHQEPDKMIVFGGSTCQGEALSDKTWIYSFAKQRWREVDTPIRPGKRDFHTAVAIPASSIVKMWGGIDDFAVWSFDATTEKWSRISSDLKYESGRSGAYFHGTLFSFGGFAMESGDLTYTNTVEWQTVDGSWAMTIVAGDIRPDGRCYAVLATTSNGLYMFGGFRQNMNPADPQRLSDLWQLTLQHDLDIRSLPELLNGLAVEIALQQREKDHIGSSGWTNYV